MTICRPSLTALMLTCLWLNCSAYVEIDLPVPEPQSNNLSENIFTVKNTTTLESDVVRRGRSLTNSQPGLVSINQFSWSRGKISMHAFYNLYTVSNSVKPSKGPTSLAGPAGTTAITTYLLTESKAGGQVEVGNAQNPIQLSINRVIYQWPNGANWLWTGPECQTTNNNLLSYMSNIKPITTTELSMLWNQYYFLYAKSDDTDKPIYSGQTQGATTEAYQATYGKAWGDYYHFKTSKYYFAPGYTYSVEAGYWENIGRYFQANVHYQFSKKMLGILKLFNFDGYGGNSNHYGASVNLQLTNHQSMVKQ